jgi:tetratricopeptide (TPR) repeat protein
LSKASQIRQKAQEYLSKGQIDKAIAEYKRLLTVESKNPNLYNELGDIYLRGADKPAAVQNFERAAVIYEKVALYNNAVAVCKKILRVEPEKLATIFKLGELRAKQKLEGEAVTYFTQYAEMVLMGSQTLLPKCQKDVERMIELMPTSDPVLAKASEILEQLGMKLKAAEIVSKLSAMALEKGDAEKHRQYAEKLGTLKRDLTSDEAREVDSLSSGAAETPDAKSAGTEPARPDPAPAPAAPVDPMPKPFAPASSLDAETAAGRSAESVATHPRDETLEQPSSVSDEHESELEPGVREAVEEARMLAAMAQGAGAETSSGPGAEEAAESADASPVQVAEKLRPAPVQAPSVSNAPAPAPIEDENDIERGLAEEITSDVEKDDLKSHYDLGMAYLEMGLYTEAIKDFQISSRYEELKLSSLEMIGHCFLKLENPRLAVKQLTKALEVGTAAGSESLGIHYNLGLAHEMLGELAAAREHFEEVYIIDMTFRDVAQKMKKLASTS